MGSTHHLVANVRFREAKSTVSVKSVLEGHSVLFVYKTLHVIKNIQLKKKQGTNQKLICSLFGFRYSH